MKRWSQYTKRSKVEEQRRWRILKCLEASLSRRWINKWILCFFSPKCCIYILNSSPYTSRVVAWLCVLDSSFSSLFRGRWLLSVKNLSTPLIVLSWTCRHVGERNLTGHNLSTCLPWSRVVTRQRSSNGRFQRLLSRIEVWILSWHVCTKPVDMLALAL